MTQSFRPGDCVVYRKPKHSDRPGPRACAVDPSPRGDSYTYCVDKFWLVRERLADVVILVTRRGKLHSISVSDPNLRRATWWERTFCRGRFPN